MINTVLVFMSVSNFEHPERNPEEKQTFPVKYLQLQTINLRFSVWCFSVFDVVPPLKLQLNISLTRKLLEKFDEYHENEPSS